MIAETSLRAYERIRPKLPMWKGKVFDYLAEHPLSTRKEIARALGMETASVSGRCAELIEDALIQEHGTKVCRISGNVVSALRIVPTQQSLF